MRSLFSSGGDDVAAVDVFANRHDEWAAVVDSIRAHVAARPTVRVDDFVSPRSNVLVFYGVGGIGKTTFSKKLEAQMAATGERQAVASWSRLPQEVGPLVPVRIDLARQGEVSFEDALLAVRLAMGRLGQPLRAFDVALRCYWEVNHPGEPLEGYLRRHGFLRRMSDSMGLPQDMRTAVEDLSQAIELPSAAGATIVGFVSSLAQALRERRDKSLALSRCARLPDLLEAPQDIDTFSYFPHLLAWDLAQIPAKHAATPVILLDTFEDVTERGYREIEKLYQRMVWLMPNALFIITGRNRLQWDDETLEGQLDWAGRHRWPQLAPTAVGEPRQHLVGYLSDDDREQYLATRLSRTRRPRHPRPHRRRTDRAPNSQPARRVLHRSRDRSLPARLRRTSPEPRRAPLRQQRPRHTLHEESAANMRRVADGNSPLARPALRGLSHIARHLGDFPQALSTLEGLDHDSNYYRALGHLWWVHGNLNLACSAYATARRVALDNDQAGIAALAQAGLAFAAALDDVDRATGQIARANDLLREVHQTWAQAQVRTAVLLQSVGADGDFTTHARELEHAYTEAGLGSALAYLRFVVCFHHAIRDDQQQLRDALTNLELSTNNGEYRYLREIVSFLPVTQPDPPASGARWIGGRDSVAHAWREIIGRRRAALGLNPPVNPMSAARVGGMSGPSSDSFSAESTYRTVELAAGETGIPIQDARLIRMGENAIYALPHANVVARSDQRLARVEKELAIGRWLAYHDYPAVRVAEHLPQPVRVDGRVVTYWNLVEPDGEVTIDQFAGLLRDFHALPAPEFTLDLFDPFAAVPGRLANAGNADPAAVAFLADMHHDLRTRYDALEFTDLGVIHGDAHRGNIIPTANGPLLCDFEVAARGPWQWDTTSLAIAVDRLGTPAADYTEFVRVYGRDVTQQPQFPVLRAARELTMTTWLMQLIDVSPGHATEFTHRISSLRDGNLQQRWNGF
ncbi:phosphotransferase family protein [Nocardia sp. NPDC059195]|uniref:phosphotransferase family protein n=1 Tax=Nocardia sp. NPDC059195 TaxID=3346765 RepID=UPI00368AEADF